MLIPLLIILASCLAGFAIATYIYEKKRAKQKLTCPIGAKCDLVTDSKYSTIFGMPIELLGMIYYAAMFVGFVIIGFINTINLSWLLILLFTVSSIAVLFSIYLISLQAFMLRQWCSWCVASAVLTIVIFLAEII